jgi:FkbM family methyltransferase
LAVDNFDKYYSQFGEDKILSAIFKDISNGICVEIGANDGITDSMTYYFEKNGWRCLLVEPIPELFNEIIRNRNCLAFNCAAALSNGDATFYVAESVEGMSSLNPTDEHIEHINRIGGKIKEIIVRTRTVDDILSEARIDKIDFISIDVEGNELDVLKGFSINKYFPKIIIIEDNSNRVDSKVPEYMEQKGYVNFKRTGVNDWYAMATATEIIDNDEVRKLKIIRNKTRVVHKLIDIFKPISTFVLEKLNDSTRGKIRIFLGL